MENLDRRVFAGGQLGRRTLFRSLRGVAVGALVVTAAGSVLPALPVAAADIEYCDVDPIVFVTVGDVRTGVKVHLGWDQRVNPWVDRPATESSIQAEVDAGKITVTATVVTRKDVGALAGAQTHMRIELLRPGKGGARTSSAWTEETIGEELTSTL